MTDDKINQEQTGNFLMADIHVIENVLKSIITKFHEVFIKDTLDDTEYIRNVKTVLSGTNDFFQVNKEAISDPEILLQKLYEFSKNLWLSGLKTRLEWESEIEDAEQDELENDDYYEYYFDYIYANDNYPR